MSKQTEREAILRLYNIYFNLCSKQDFVGMCLVYNLITSIALEGSTRRSKRF